MHGGENGVWVGGKFIPPGECGHFPERDVPAHLKGSAPVKKQPVAKVKSIIEQVEELNANELMKLSNTLGEQDLQTIKAWELEGKKRKSVLERLDSEILQRISDALESLGDDIASISEAIKSMSPDTVAQLLAVERETKKRDDVIQLMESHLVATGSSAEANDFLALDLDAMKEAAVTTDSAVLGQALDIEKQEQARPEVIELIESVLTYPA